MTSRNTAPAVLHVGYPKTASTYLQGEIFDNPDCGFGLPGGAVNRGYLMEWLRASDGYDFDGTAIAGEMDTLEAPLRAKGLRPVWSDETILGDPLTRTYDGAWNLQKLVKIGRPAKVIITIRHQHSLVLSAYREYLKLNSHSLTDFIGTGTEARSYRPILRTEYLLYDKVVAHWQEAFGAENVLVLPQERLNSDPEAFLGQLARFLDHPQIPVPQRGRANVGLGGTALRFARPLNTLYQRSPLSQHRSLTERLVKKSLRVIDRLSPTTLDQKLEMHWKTQIKHRYAGVYEASNRRLAAMTGLDLAALGYPI